jgi:hypothetical protein
MGKRAHSAEQPKDTRTAAADVEKEADALERAAERKERALARLAKAAAEEAKLKGPAGAAEEPIVIVNDRVQEILDSLSGSGCFDVVKFELGNPKNLGTYDLDLWPNAMEAVVRANGSGEYLTLIKDSTGKIATRIQRTYKVPEPAAAVVPPAPPAAADPFKFFELMEQRDSRRNQEIEAMRVELAKVQAASQQQLMEVLKANNQGSLNLKELLPLVIPVLPSIVKMLKGDERDPLERMLDLKELMDDLKGDAPQPSGTIDKVLAALASAFVPGTAAALGAGMGARRRALPRPGAPAAPAAAAAPAAIPTTAAAPLPPGAPPASSPAGAPGDPQPVAAAAAPVPAAAEPAAPGPVPAVAEIVIPGGKKVIPLGQFIPQFVSAIQEGHTPEAAAEAVFNDALNKSQDAMLEAAVEHGDWEALTTDPRLAQHTEWVARFRAALEQLLGDPEEAGAAG